MKDTSIKKVLVIGSGPIVIGQAAEFDYAGTQACRILKKEGIETVLVNSNPATIMTDPEMADEIYLEPLTLTTIERIIEREKPDAVLAGLGGQTGLTMAMELDKNGFLKSHGVRLLGTDAKAIDRSEDRQLFKDAMDKIGIPTIESGTAENIDDALRTADEIGYPVIIRPAFTLGGGGGGVAYSREEMEAKGAAGLDASPISQILVEKYIAGLEEIEFEAMRDNEGNKIIVCSMENIDPVGVHTGDSIVVAPALTLPQKDMDMLRRASLDIVEELQIKGGCNCQYAYDPDTGKYYVIEVNPRVSRSSALASKATGYPIAKITALIALGYNLPEIKFDPDAEGTAFHEPEVDYTVLKLPRWPFDKFTNTGRKLGTQMKATGEVMAIGSCVEEALMKAVRGAEIKKLTLGHCFADVTELEQEYDGCCTDFENAKKELLKSHVAEINDLRLYAIFEALKAGVSIDEIFEITKINRFFLEKINNLAKYEKEISEGINAEQYVRGKKLGYTDRSLMDISGCDKLPMHLDASYKCVDTMRGAFGAMPYYYATYNDADSDTGSTFDACSNSSNANAGSNSSTIDAGIAKGDIDDADISACALTVPYNNRRILVLGSGPIRIGQGIEFDYSSVKCVEVLRRLGYEVIIINNNPETVSTDYDTADRLYFEPVTIEDVMNVIKKEKPYGVVVAFGGQTAIKLAIVLDKMGVRILGTSADGIDRAEDREKFDAFLESLGQKRPRAVAVETAEEALIAARILGYPVLLRPSYVIGGQGMSIVRSAEEVRKYMGNILSGRIANSVLVDKYMPGTELEVDCISDGSTVVIPGIMEHIERAGIHSGDSIAVYPPYNIDDVMVKKITEVSSRIAMGLGTKGIVNIQYLVFNGELYIIEVNPRASRTVPYISKVTGIPMVELASRIMLGETLKDMGYNSGLCENASCYAVKVPVFSFEKISDANSILGPEMKSTGEVLGIGRTKTEAMYKGLAASGVDVHTSEKRGEDGILISVEDYDYRDAIAMAEKFTDLGMRLYATPDTAKAIRARGLEVTTAGNICDCDDIYDLIDNEKVRFVVYTGAVMDSSVGDFRNLYKRCMNRHIPCMTSIDTAMAIADIIGARYDLNNTGMVDINK